MSNLSYIIRSIIREELELALEGRESLKTKKNLEMAKDAVAVLQQQEKSIQSNEDKLEHQLKINQAKEKVIDAARRHADAMDKDINDQNKEIKFKLQNVKDIGNTEGTGF